MRNKWSDGLELSPGAHLGSFQTRRSQPQRARLGDERPAALKVGKLRQNDWRAPRAAPFASLSFNSARADQRSPLQRHPARRVVSCASPEDVAAAIAAAARRLPLAVRSGGHYFAGRSSTEGVLIDVSPLRAVAVADGRATIGAGALLGDVYDALDAHGVTLPAGCGTTSGSPGLTLGGGLGHPRAPPRRAGGLAARRRGRAGRRQRGRGRPRPVVGAARAPAAGASASSPALDFATVEAPAMTAFETFWDDAETLIAAWQDWAPDAPDELAASLLITSPPLGVKVFGAYAGPEAELREIVAALGEPQRPAFSYGSAARPSASSPGWAARARTTTGTRTCARSTSRSRSRPTRSRAGRPPRGAGGFHRELDFSPWGGAYVRTPADATAFAHRDARFLLKHAAVVAPGEDVGRGARVARPLLRDHPPVRHRRRLPQLPRGRLGPWAPRTTSATASGCSRSRPLRPRRRVRDRRARPRPGRRAARVEREARGFYGRLLGLPSSRSRRRCARAAASGSPPTRRSCTSASPRTSRPRRRPTPACGSAPSGARRAGGDADGGRRGRPLGRSHRRPPPLRHLTRGATGSRCWPPRRPEPAPARPPRPARPGCRRARSRCHDRPGGRQAGGTARRRSRPAARGR